MAACSRCSDKGTVVYMGQTIACPDCADRIGRGR